MKLKLVISLIIIGFLFSSSVFSAESINIYPHLANYYLKWELSLAEARELAKWDLLILDMEIQENSPDALNLIRELNPDVIILAYITSQEIIDDVNKAAGFTTAFLRTKLRNQIAENWWLKDTSGKKISHWPGTYMLNLSNVSPTNYQGQRFNDFLPEFVANNIYPSGFFDGIFYDNTWGDISWVSNNEIDINGDGKINEPVLVDSLWAEGYRKMLEKTKNLLGNDFIIVGNGRVFWDYQDLLNGMMLESFPSSWENGGHWSGSMETYLKLPSINKSPNLSIINVNTKQENNYQAMRFGLVSTLLGDGFYSFDYDTSNHTQTWWYDEYSVNLGPAVSSAYNLLKENSANIEPGLWRRDFKFASVILNSTNKPQFYLFPKENFEKIKGKQDPVINNGEKINFVTIQPEDGLVLFKSSDIIINSAFVNGYFYRVFNDTGEQIRNGFFSFSNSFPAGATTVITDGSQHDFYDVNLIANKGRISLNKNSQEIAAFSPYNNLFREQLNIDTKINDGFIEKVIIGPTRGGGPQVRVFSGSGHLISSFFAYNKNLRGGVSVALKDISNNGHLEIITGAPYGEKPIVKIFSLNGELKHSFFAYDENFRGGVEVAVGDINGNNKMEIVTVPGPGGGPQVRIFNENGRVLGQFFAYDKQQRNGLKITLSDINQDNKQEILVGIKNLF